MHRVHTQCTFESGAHDRISHLRRLDLILVTAHGWWSIGPVPMGKLGNSSVRREKPFLMTSKSPSVEIELVKALLYLEIRVNSPKELVPKQPLCTKNREWISDLRLWVVSRRVVFGPIHVHQRKRGICCGSLDWINWSLSKVTVALVYQFSMVNIEMIQKFF